MVRVRKSGSARRGQCSTERLETRRLLSATPTYVDVADFNSPTVGLNVTGGVVADAAGDLFGVTAGGGVHSDGTVFEIPAGSNTIDTLYAFDDEPDGYAPAGPLLIDSSGNLFGVTTCDGTSHGTVFEVSAGSHAFSTIASVGVDNGDGSPNGGLVEDSAGDLFGTSQSPNFAPNGYVFEVSAAAGRAVKTLGVSNISTGDVTIGPNGTLYGVSPINGADHDGTIFSIAADGGRYDQVTHLADFANATTVSSPIGAPLLESDGTLLGITRSGEAYELTPGSSTPTPAAFSSTEPFTADPAGDVFAVEGGVIVEQAAGADPVGLGPYDIASFGPITGPVCVTSNGALYDTTGSAVFELAPGSAVTSTTTTLVALAPAVYAGQAATLTATVSPAGATGTVTFTEIDAATGCRSVVNTVPVLADGTAIIGDTLDDAVSVTAAYSGDRTHTPSTSTAVTLAILPPPTVPTIRLTDTLPEDGSLSASVTFTAILTDNGGEGSPTGSVTFNVNGVDFSEVALNANGVATLQTSQLPVGTDVVMAVYTGDAEHVSVTGGPVTVVSYARGVYVSDADLSVNAFESFVSGASLKGSFPIVLSSDDRSVEHGPVTIRVYLSTNSTLDAYDVPIGSLKRQVRLEPEASLKLNLPLRGTLPTVTGQSDVSYDLLAEAIGPDGSTNVTDLTTITHLSPDVEPPYVRLSETLAAPTSVKPPLLRLKIDLDDIGNSPAVGDATITLALDSGTQPAVQLSDAVIAVRLRLDKDSVVHLKVALPTGLPAGKYVLTADVSLLSAVGYAAASINILD